MPKWVSKIRLAEIAGVTKAAITKAARVQFPGAVDGHRVDLDHPEAQIYLQRRGVDPTKVTVSAPPAPREAPPNRPPVPMYGGRPDHRVGPSRGGRPPARASSPPEAAPDPDAGGDYPVPEEIAPYAHMTLDMLVRRFGTAIRFVTWLDARKRISDIHERDLKIAERTGRLISRELVRTAVFSYFEELNRRLLTDTATTLARRIYQIGRAGGAIEDAEQLARDLIRQTIHPVKTAITRAVRTFGAEIEDDAEAVPAQQPSDEHVP